MDGEPPDEDIQEPPYDLDDPKGMLDRYMASNPPRDEMPVVWAFVSSLVLRPYQEGKLCPNDPTIPEIAHLDLKYRHVENTEDTYVTWASNHHRRRVILTEIVLLHRES